MANDFRSTHLVFTLIDELIRLVFPEVMDK